ncbi:MAG: hypothetical protein HWE25_06760 [Alphaproteobacteria bacterium]|nr:hypothetical protein [Alphaproteobacteria bacterium]
MKHFLLTLLGVFALTTSTNAGVETHVERHILQTDKGPETILMTRPSPLPTGQIPVLIAPGDRNDTKPMFFWGEEPGNLGWIMVQTERLYRGSSEQLDSVMTATEAYLNDLGLEVEGFHIIGWSANSGAATRHAANLGARLQSLSLIPGYGTASAVQNLCSFEHLQVNFITGSRDIGWLRGAERMRDQLHSCGASKIAFKVIAGGGHVLEEISGKPLFDILDRGRQR